MDDLARRPALTRSALLRADFLERWRPALGFVAGYLFLSALENVRYPSGLLGFNVFLPNLDLVALFGVYVWLGRKGRRLPRGFHALVVASFLLVRVFRIGDGISMRFLRREFHLHFDAVLLPDLVRLFATTGSLALLVLGGLLLVAGLALAGFLTHRALRHAERCLAEPKAARAYAGVVALFCVLSVLVREATRPDPIYTGAFASSGVARVAREGMILARLPRARRELSARIQATSARLQAKRNDLAKLRDVDVFLFFVESYGETVLRSPAKSARIKPTYAAIEAALGARGFGIVSSLIDAPVAGGGSWLAHATFSTGVTIDEQLSYDLITLADPPALSDFFEAAGHRTVLIQPGTTRPGAHGGFRHYQQKYFGPSFDYRGPEVGWGRFPDQYVLDWVQRREPRRDRPRFFEYVLVTSHVPWSAEVPVLEWARIGDGSIYHSVPIRRNPSRWTDLSSMAGAYTATIVYDLETIRAFLEEFVHDDALVIVLGDHQPNSAVVDDGSSFGVPIHVLSRKRELIEPFQRRGYSPGLWPRTPAPYAKMADFLEGFLLDFSEARAARALPVRG